MTVVWKHQWIGALEMSSLYFQNQGLPLMTKYVQLYIFMYNKHYAVF